MGSYKRLFFGGLAVILACTLAAQPGAQKLNTLEWANFGTGTGQGYFIYTPDPDGEPEYVPFLDVLNATSLASDDQQITAFTYSPATQQLSITIEDGNTRTISLSTLNEELQLVGNTLSLANSDSPDINLAPYLDNTDDQQLTDIQYDNLTNLLTVELENGGTASVVLDYQESDPIFTGHPSSGISQVDIDFWNADNDPDPNNEDDNITVGQTAGHNFIINGNRDNVNEGRNVVVEIELDSTIQLLAFAANSGTDDQILSFDADNDLLNLEEGGPPISLAKYNNSNVECVEVKNIATSSHVSPIQLPNDVTKRSIWINGVRCSEELILTHTQHVTINFNTQNVTFYEILDSDIVAFCRN